VNSKIQWPRVTYQTDVTTFLWEYIIIATKIIIKFLINQQKPMLDMVSTQILQTKVSTHFSLIKT
jgi:hypothetical protein